MGVNDEAKDGDKCINEQTQTSADRSMSAGRRQRVEESEKDETQSEANVVSVGRNMGISVKPGPDR